MKKEKTEVSSVNSKEAETYYNNGIAKYDLKNYKEAILDYDMVIELNPEFALAYYNRGSARHNIKNYIGAVLDYNKAIKLDPDLKN